MKNIARGREGVSKVCDREADGQRQGETTLVWEEAMESEDRVGRDLVER